MIYMQKQEDGHEYKYISVISFGTDLWLWMNANCHYDAKLYQLVEWSDYVIVCISFD